MINNDIIPQVTCKMRNVRMLGMFKRKFNNANNNCNLTICERECEFSVTVVCFYAVENNGHLYIIYLGVKTQNINVK